MLTKTMPELFFIHSDLDIVYANPMACALLGAESPEELTGTPLIDLVTSDYRSPLRERVAHIYGGDERTSGLNVELQTDTDQPQRAILVSSVVEWDDTERVQTSVFPITGTPSDSDRLLYNQATDQAPLGITVSDPSQPDNPLINVNGGFCEQTGYDRKETLGRNCRFLQGEATREQPVARMREAITAEEPVTVELRNYRKDGSMFWNRLTISPVYDADGSLANFIGFQENVSSLMQQQRQIGILDRYLRHNLRNSLNIIGGHAELIQQEGTPSDAAHAKTIEQASWNLLMNIEKEREITELLRSDLNPTTIELMPLLRAIADRYEQEYPEATISIDGPHSVRVDALPKLSIAFEELVQNAIQHTDHESPSVDITVTADDDVVHVAIADNGPGIPAMEIEVLVNSDVENPTYHGQGFGLWMVYLILEHSGGAVEFQDGEDGGTLVVVKLPPSAPVSD
jgi:PAS domain S-box-containing protein